MIKDGLFIVFGIIIGLALSYPATIWIVERDRAVMEISHDLGDIKHNLKLLSEIESGTINCKLLKNQNVRVENISKEIVNLGKPRIYEPTGTIFVLEEQLNKIQKNLNSIELNQLSDTCK